MAEDVREDAMKNTLSFAALLSLTLLPAYAQKTVEYRQFTVPAMRYIAAGPEGNALVSLTRKYITGEGVPASPQELAKHVSLAAESGDQWAQLMLGLLYYSGRGVDRDIVLCHMWSNLAGAGPDEKIAVLARQQREWIEQNLSTAQIARSGELAQNWQPHGAQPAKASARKSKKAAPESQVAQSLSTEASK